MTVTVSEFASLGSGMWRLSWASDASDPTFTVYRNGILFDTTTSTSITVALDDGDVIEVIDDGGDPANAFKSRITVQWNEVASAEYYTVSELIDGAYVQRAKVLDNGSPVYEWTSRVLEDGQQHTFKVVPTGTNGNDGTATTVTFRMVRHPSPELCDHSWDATEHALTFTEA